MRKLLVFTLTAAALAQAPIQVTTRLVQVAVVVRDKRGAVADLTKSDFEITDKGKSRQIATFSVARASDRVPRASLPPNTFSNRLDRQSESPIAATVLLFDSLNTKFKDQADARRQVLTFLKALDPETPDRDLCAGQQSAHHPRFHARPSQFDARARALSRLHLHAAGKLPARAHRGYSADAYLTRPHHRRFARQRRSGGANPPAAPGLFNRSPRRHHALRSERHRQSHGRSPGPQKSHLDFGRVPAESGLRPQRPVRRLVSAEYLRRSHEGRRHGHRPCQRSRIPGGRPRVAGHK